MSQPEHLELLLSIKLSFSKTLLEDLDLLIETGLRALADQDERILMDFQHLNKETFPIYFKVTQIPFMMRFFLNNSTNGLSKWGKCRFL
jgi:hypothetical protein